MILSKSKVGGPALSLSRGPVPTTTQRLWTPTPNFQLRQFVLHLIDPGLYSPHSLSSISSGQNWHYHGRIGLAIPSRQCVNRAVNQSHAGRATTKRKMIMQVLREDSAHSHVCAYPHGGLRLGRVHNYAS